VSAPTLSADVLPVHVIAGPAVLEMLDDVEVVVVPEPIPGGVVLVAARTAAEALAACPPLCGNVRVVVMADTFTREDVVRALHAGVSTFLQTSRTTPAQLASALHALRDGEGRMPHEVLVRALGGAADPNRLPVPPPRLTTRQVAVLRLMADGLGNADIARTLSCSEHTVKNVIYELMARLHARNRAHAVATAVRRNLI
jgi:DNA-binding NarL/FixJ family response regulator